MENRQLQGVAAKPSWKERWKVLAGTPIQELVTGKANVPGTLGVVVQSGGFCVTVLVRNDANDQVDIQHCEFVHCEEHEVEVALTQYVSEAKLQGISCVLLADPGSYKLHLIDAPKVDHSEMKDAIRWRVKDLIDYDINDAVIDIFNTPSINLQHKDKEMMYAVVADKHEINAKVQMAHNAGLDVKAVDIPELALRNVTNLLAENEQGVALIYLMRYSGFIIVCYKSVLYLARSIPIGTHQIFEAHEHDEHPEEGEIVGEEQHILDGIMLEVQRSLDYYERHCNNPPITSLVFAPLPDMSDIMSYMAQGLGITVRMMDLNANALLKSDFNLPDGLQNQAILSLGAALRGEVDL